MTLLSSVARLPHFHRGPLLGTLSAESTRRLAGELQETELPEGALLWNVGPDPRVIFFPLSGIVSIRVPTRDGHGIEVATIGAEGAVGFHDGSETVPVLTQAVVQAGGRFASIAAEAFDAAGKDCEELGRAAAVCKAWLLLQSQRAALCNAVHSADARFCR
jgi:hypothetical protein